uniref:Uncharacterized protein n=1 Tax=Sphaerodactylus townsendi TaxID=933632 RepID=A0ACB8EQ22_9SAUR
MFLRHRWTVTLTPPSLRCLPRREPAGSVRLTKCGCSFRSGPSQEGLCQVWELLQKCSGGAVADSSDQPGVERNGTRLGFPPRIQALVGAVWP